MKRRWLGGGLFLAAAVLLLWWGATYFSFDALVHQEWHLRRLIAEHPGVAWVLGFFFYLLLSLVPGTRGKAVVCGWLFGFWPALVIVNGALTLAALAGFLLSRHFFHDAIASRYPIRLEQVNRELQTRGAYYVLLLRLVPVSFSLTNYVFGATKVEPRTYWWATQLGLLPGNLIFVNAGARLPDLSQVITHGWSILWSWETTGSLVLLSLFTLLVPTLLRVTASRRSDLPRSPDAGHIRSRLGENPGDRGSLEVGPHHDDGGDLERPERPAEKETEGSEADE